MKKEKRSPRVLIFAGTTEGRILAEYAASLGLNCHISTATEYGEKILENIDGIETASGRMDEGKIGDFIREKQIDFVIDATHPFAVEATLNIRRACDAEHTEYIRCLRESAVISQEEDAGIVTAGSVREAVAYLRHTKGNIFIATGSKELQLYTEIEEWQERCFARVLSTRESVEQAVRTGFEGKHLIAMQGPFSYELNLAMLRQIQAEYFVTKESGRAGGFAEKLRAAAEAGAVAVVIGRPEEEGESLEAVMKRMDELYKNLEFSRIVIKR